MYAALIFVAACSPNFKYFFHDNNYLGKLNTAYLCVCVCCVCVCGDVHVYEYFSH